MLFFCTFYLSVRSWMSFTFFPQNSIGKNLVKSRLFLCYQIGFSRGKSNVGTDAHVVRYTFYSSVHHTFKKGIHLFFLKIVLTKKWSVFGVVKLEILHSRTRVKRWERCTCCLLLLSILKCQRPLFLKIVWKNLVKSKLFPVTLYERPGFFCTFYVVLDIYFLECHSPLMPKKEMVAYFGGVTLVSRTRVKRWDRWTCLLHALPKCASKIRESVTSFFLKNSFEKLGQVYFWCCHW